MYNDDPQWYAGGILWPKLLYGDQPAGRLCIGTEESIKSLRRHHFLEYMRKLYVASNMVVCLAGHIPDTNKVYLDIAQNFGLVSQDTITLFKPPVVENQIGPALLLAPRPLEQSSILLGVRAYPINHSDYYVLGVIKSLLGAGMSSRMFTEVREKRGLAYAVYTSLDAQTDVGNFCTIAGLKREKIFEGLRVILDQYCELAAGRVTEEELARTKAYIRGAKLIKAEQSQNIAMDLASKFILLRETQSSEDEMKKIEAVSLADIERVARNIFVNEKLNLVVVGPHNDMEEEFLKSLKL
jgi:predicted Zn-dependent peptidase